MRKRLAAEVAIQEEAARLARHKRKAAVAKDWKEIARFETQAEAEARVIEVKALGPPGTVWRKAKDEVRAKRGIIGN